VSRDGECPPCTTETFWRYSLVLLLLLLLLRLGDCCLGVRSVSSFPVYACGASLCNTTPDKLPDTTGVEPLSCARVLELWQITCLIQHCSIHLYTGVRCTAVLALWQIACIILLYTSV